MCVERKAKRIKKPGHLAPIQSNAVSYGSVGGHDRITKGCTAIHPDSMCSSKDFHNRAKEDENGQDSWSFR
jgi:hypothetical protein